MIRFPAVLMYERSFPAMEYTSSTSLHFPAAYAPISEDEMIYIEGGADVISPQQFTYNLVTNLIRLMGQAAFSGAVTGLINMRQTPVGKAATVLFTGFAGYAAYIYAVQLINNALNIYTDVKNNYYNDGSSTGTTTTNPTAASTAALTAA